MLFSLFTLTVKKKELGEGKVKRERKNRTVPFLLPVLLIIVAAGTWKLARSAWDSLVHFRAPRFIVEPGKNVPPISRMVVLVVIDGLRADAFERMEYVSSLKKEGAFFTLRVGQPSLTMPCSATIATGAWQDITGVTTNWFKGPLQLDSIFSLARDNGLTSAIVGEDVWGELFSHQATRVEARKREDGYITFDEQTLEKALGLVAEAGLDSSAGSSTYFRLLLLVHFVDTDYAGHDFGGASAEYQEYANRIGRLIEKLHRALPENATLVITADHGQIDSGGHGGWESVVIHVPVLLLGKGIKPGNYGEAEQTDVAPTVAALAGLPLPPYSQGRILTEALDWGEKKGEVLRELEELMATQKQSFTRAYLGAIGIKADKISARTNPQPGESLSAYWQRIFAAGRQTKIKEERIRNIPLAGAVFFLPLLGFWFFKRKYGLKYARPLLFSLFYFACFYGLFFVSGKTISLSSINDEDLLQRFFNEVMLYAAMAVVLSIIVQAWLERRKTAGEVAKASIFLTAWTAYLIILQMDIFFLINGPVIRWYLPDMFFGFKYYLDMLTLMVVGVLSPLLPLLSVAVSKLGKAHSFTRFFWG